MCGPVRGAIIGGLIYEGLASNKEEAEKLAASGEITFDSCHHHNAVGPMAGIVTYSMPVWKVVNKTYGNYAYCTFNEGLGKVLRFGAFGDELFCIKSDPANTNGFVYSMQIGCNTGRHKRPLP